MADPNPQNQQGSQQGNQQQAAKLAQAQKAEQAVMADESVLYNEDELLGLNKPEPTKAQTTKEKAENFLIPQAVKDKYPNLVPLIIETESMDDEEREYWFQILPIMTEDQVVKLQQILDGEKKQLAKLDSEYEAELAKINEKHLQEWQTFESKQNREELAKKEEAAEKEEADLEADLLSKLADL